MNVIYKYPLTGVVTDIPRVGEVRHIAYQNKNDSMPTVWVEHWSVEEKTKRRLKLSIIATGEKFDSTSVGRFVGTVLSPAGTFVWHIFEDVI